MDTDHTRKRMALVILLLTVIVTALFLGQGTANLLVLAFLDTSPAAASAGGPRAATAAAPRERRDPAAMARRNIFDSETGNVWDAPVAVVGEEGEEMAAEFDPNAPLPPCEGSVRLVGSMVNVRRREWSFASITGPAGKAMLFREGMSIEGRRLLAIQPAAVILQPSTGPCRLAMFSPRAAPGARRPAVGRPVPPRTAAANTGSISAADLESGITRVSDNRFNVQRSLVTQLLENQTALMRTARIIPHEEGGRTVGVKLYGIRRSSLLGRLGIQNGDMLRTINGYDMTSPDGALEAYARLRSADHLTISMVRRGQPMNLDYAIQ